MKFGDGKLLVQVYTKSHAVSNGASTENLKFWSLKSLWTGKDVGVLGGSIPPMACMP